MSYMVSPNLHFNDEQKAIRKLNEIYNNKIPSHFSSYTEFLKRHHKEEYNKIFTNK